MRRLFGSMLLATFALGACTAPGTSSIPGPAASTAAKTVYVTRHMQKQDGDDPALSEEGVAAAERLADMLGDRGIVAIFATATKRAMETAAPLANLTGVAITPYDPRSPQLLARSVAAVPGAVLVVGHSNTVHDLIARFGGTPQTPLTEQDYGLLFVIDAKGRVEVLEVEG